MSAKKTTKKTTDLFQLVLSSFDKEERSKDEIKAERMQIVNWGRENGYKSEGLVYYLTADVPDYPKNAEGVRIPFGSIMPTKYGSFRQTRHFRALNSFKSWLVYNFESNLEEKTKAPKVSEKTVKAELADCTVAILKKKAKVYAVPESVTKKEDLVNAITNKILEGHKEPSSQEKVIKTFKTLRERVEKKRTFSPEIMAQLKAKLTDIVQLLESGIKH